MTDTSLFLNIGYMNVDVQIYVSQFKTFFQDNPQDFLNLVGKADPDKFFEKVGQMAQKNLNEGSDIELTQKQLIEIILELNDMGSEEIKEIELKVPMLTTPFGNFFLN